MNLFLHCVIQLLLQKIIVFFSGFSVGAIPWLLYCTYSTPIQFTVINYINSALDSLVLWKIGGAPILMILLIASVLFFNVKYKLVNVRFFFTAFKNMFFCPKEHLGTISHFQAFSTAVSGTVGLGTIAGVAIGVATGGPGVVGWMMVFGFLAMPVKFAEVYLSFKYRMIKRSGEIIGGPFAYIKSGISEIGYPRIAAFMASLYAVAITLAGLAGSVPFQANQLIAMLVSKNIWIHDHIEIASLCLAILSAAVIAGGIKKIARVTSILTPFMTIVYVFGSIIVLIYYFDNLIPTLNLIVRSMFSVHSASLGLLGILTLSYTKALFANEAGMGTAATYHATAKDNNPFRAALIAMIEPFFDTMLMCCITGVVILSSGAYLMDNVDGINMTVKAFSSVSKYMPIFIYLSVPLFAFSTIISFSYNCEMAFRYMFGSKSLKYLRLLILFVIYFASTYTDFSKIASIGDKVFLIAALVNVTAVVFLSSKVIPNDSQKDVDVSINEQDLTTMNSGNS